MLNDKPSVGSRVQTDDGRKCRITAVKDKDATYVVSLLTDDSKQAFDAMPAHLTLLDAEGNAPPKAPKVKAINTSFPMPAHHTAPVHHTPTPPSAPHPDPFFHKNPTDNQ